MIFENDSFVDVDGERCLVSSRLDESCVSVEGQRSKVKREIGEWRGEEGRNGGSKEARKEGKLGL